MQAGLFNRILAERIQDGLLHRVLLGDVMQRRGSKGCFLVCEVHIEQQRFDNRETVVSGPMFGPKMKSAAGEVASRESKVLGRFELNEDDFQRFKRITRGTRRGYLVWPEELTIEPETDGLRFRFCLPSGTYATTLMREFIKEP